MRHLLSPFSLHLLLNFQGVVSSCEGFLETHHCGTKVIPLGGGLGDSRAVVNQRTETGDVGFEKVKSSVLTDHSPS
jgi:hypothetical protein